MTKNLRRLLNPASIAIVGGGVWAENAIQNCRALGYVGPIWVVHPTRESLAGAQAYPTVDDLPETPDAALLCVNRHATVDAVAALSKRGCGGVVCLASGFAEASAEDQGASDLQAALLKAAGEMPLIGPNCYGFVSYLDGVALWPDQQGGQRADRGVAVISQSSNISMNISMTRGGLPLAYVATAGNQAQLSLAAIGEAMLSDPRVTALGLHIEGVNDPAAFEALTDTARRLRKPIVALKAGRSELARQATISHTASLAGSDAGARAFLNRLGIAKVESLPQMLETLKLLHAVGPLPSNNIASLSCSGGEAGLIADVAEGRGVRFAPLTDQQRTDLRDALGPMVALNNPLDYHTYIWRDAEALGKAFTAMLDPGLSLACVILDYPREDRCDGSDWDRVIDGMRIARSQRGTPMALVTTLQDTLPEQTAQTLLAEGIAPLNGLVEAITAVEAAAFLGKTLSRPPAPAVWSPSKASGGKSTVLSEAEAKILLARHGVRVPASGRAETPEAAAVLAGSLGVPVALKGEGIAHKTEAGAVKLNLSGAGEVLTAAQAIDAKSFLVEEMVTDTVAELLIGVVADPAHGYVLTLATGGVLTELLSDSVSMLLPVYEVEIREALAQLRVAKLLAGYRGMPAANLDTIVHAVLSVQDFVRGMNGAVEEVEINPLMCTPWAAYAADALIRMKEAP
ncbi:acetate--CoA ligase family protein [Pseudoruegeria sp. SHC-113]|uniref:acetate--CoA ligase family protein n=1 Tax=Pseudoruegeria sp. SHC-113 TaxID=2855439 RepID=UPI0021BB09C3|nr:acetate--CoA ligase family protein [Pseudoruegeria sp. SHC-113]MCT8161552.1 acetate--CoA ligase family protein [Pseudoruegeria sp. SHC-113]